jgi:hypothetical protein
MKTALSLLALLSVASVATAQINVAATVNGGIATQSSLWTGGATADKAIDGNRDARWAMGSIQHTNFEAGAWWRVAFNGAHAIDQVNIWNRDDGLSTRINPFNVELFLNGAVVWSSLSNVFVDNINDGLTTTIGMQFSPGAVVADAMRVQLAGSNYLHMAEVEAYTAVPEPATMAVLAMGAAAFLRRRQR